MLTGEIHSFDLGLAQKYGLEESLIIHHIAYWIKINERRERNFHEGRYWTYQTMDEMASHFPYLGKNKVVNILDKLCKGKSRFSKKGDEEFSPILIKGNFNQNKNDHTVWYTFTEDFSMILWPHNIDIVESKNEEVGLVFPQKGYCANTKSISMIQIEEIKKEERERENARCASHTHAKNFLKFGEHVKLTAEQHEKLCQDHGTEFIQDLIERMNDWISAGKDKPFKDYAAAIRNWVRNAYNNKGSTTPQGNQVERNRGLANAFLQKLPKNNPGRIEIGHDYVEFISGPYNTTVVKFSDPAFKEQCLNVLRHKWGIDVLNL